MVHNQIHTIDLLIIAAYLIAMVLIGLVVESSGAVHRDFQIGDEIASGRFQLVVRDIAGLARFQLPENFCFGRLEL